MSASKGLSVFFVLWAGLLGMAAFFLSGLLADVFIVGTDNYIIGMFIAGAVGALLLGLFLRMGRLILPMSIVGAFAMPIGLLLSFGIFGGLGALLSSIGLKLVEPGSADTMAIMFLAGFFATAVGTYLYGKKAIPLFFILTAITALPFARMVVSFNLGAALRVTLQELFSPLGPIDLNNLLILLAAGLGTGLSIAISRIFLKQPVKQPESTSG